MEAYESNLKTRPEGHSCKQCDYTGYSPSGFVVLSPGELECPECEGAGYAHSIGHPEWEATCEECEGSGTVSCGTQGGAA